jgi:hypothetical protein
MHFLKKILSQILENQLVYEKHMKSFSKEVAEIVYENKIFEANIPFIVDFFSKEEPNEDGNDSYTPVYDVYEDDHDEISILNSYEDQVVHEENMQQSFQEAYEKHIYELEV